MYAINLISSKLISKSSTFIIIHRDVTPYQIERSDAHVDPASKMNMCTLLLFHIFHGVFHGLAVPSVQTNLDLQFNMLLFFCIFLFWFAIITTQMCSSFLLVNLITASHSHPAFDEADYIVIQEREYGFLHQNFSVAKLRMHLLCQ